MYSQTNDFKFISNSSISSAVSGAVMPKELTDEKEFVEISERALECRVKRLQDVVKLKLRTQGHLYTFKADPTKAAELLKLVKCEVIEA